jgi:hypothetical protein
MFNLYILKENNNNINKINLVFFLFGIILMDLLINTNQLSSFNLIDKTYKIGYRDFNSNNEVNKNNKILISEDYMLNLFLNKKIFNIHRDIFHIKNRIDLRPLNFKQIIKNESNKEITFNNSFKNKNYTNNIMMINHKLAKEKNKTKIINSTRKNNQVKLNDKKIKKISIIHDQNINKKIDSLTKIIERMEMINNITGFINQKAEEKNGINLNDTDLGKEINLKLINNNNNTVTAEISSSNKNEKISQIEINIGDKNTDIIKKPSNCKLKLE